MKTSIRILLTTVVLCAAGTAVTLAAKEEKPAPVGSIRPSGKTQPSDLPGLARISFQQALTAALAKSPGSVIKVELEVEDGNLMYSFEIVGPNKEITEVEIDAGNGKVLNTEDEAAEKEDKADNARKE